MEWVLSSSNGTSISDEGHTRNGILTSEGGIVDTKMGVLSIQGKGEADLGDVSDTCLGDPEKCNDGITLGFWMRHRGTLN
jgi:hypothetical protein